MNTLQISMTSLLMNTLQMQTAQDGNFPLWVKRFHEATVFLALGPRARARASDSRF